MNNAYVTDEDLLAMVDKRRRESDEENRVAKEEDEAEAKAQTEAANDLPEMPTAGTPDGDFPTANDDDK